MGNIQSDVYLCNFYNKNKVTTQWYRIIRILNIAKKRIRELEDGSEVGIQIMSKI